MTFGALVLLESENFNIIKVKDHEQWVVYFKQNKTW